MKVGAITGGSGGALWATGEIIDGKGGRLGRAGGLMEDIGQAGVFGGLAIAAAGAMLSGAELMIQADPIHPFDVRHAAGPARARAAAALASDQPGVAVPTDDVQLLLLRERLAMVMAAVEGPDDPCGWYLFGWDQHGLLMKRILDEAGLEHALRLASSKGDDAGMMRLTGIDPSTVDCPRYWFGFRDANHALADALEAQAERD